MKSWFKRRLLPIALVAACGGLAQTVRQFIPRHKTETDIVRSLETGFPKDRPVPIDVRLMTGSSELLTSRDLRDQVRDWLLLTTLAASGMDPEKLNEVTFDLPPVRYGFMKPVADWEYGPLRSRAIGNGTVVALMPAGSGPRRTGYLCDIADQSRKSLGQMPARFVILEYEIDADLASATLTRRETVEGRQVFGPQFGYVEQRIKTLEDFNSFQSQVDDVTYAAVREGAVVLGGRRIPGRAIRGLKTADIAALWQAEDKLTVASQELKEFTEQKERELKARWEHVTYRRDDYAEKARLERKIEADRAVVHEEIEAFRKQHHSADSLGFSLDPAYDYQRMADFVERYLPRVPADPSKLTEETDKRAPYRELLGSLKPWAPGTNSGRPTLPASEVAAVAASLRKGSTREFFSALGKLEGKYGEQFYSQCEEEFGMQAARYDGDLQYTEPGMVLFYTDLLAKLWALDFGHASPEGKIEDFVPMTRVKVSPVFRTELQELSHTRLWFGPQNKGFQISPNKEVILSRIATRLYAASSTSLKQGEESPPNAQSAAFLGWWDDHFEEVARYEPEYERLNEVMKWSLILGWLHQNGELQDLACLREVRVDRNNWFPDWVRAHPELRFTKWQGIQFYPKGTLGMTTEALPRLASELYEIFGQRGHFLKGGVSLASRETFAERPLLSTRVAEGLRRSNLKYTESLGNEFKTLENVEYNLAKRADRYEVAIKPSAEMRLRGRVGELANQPISRTLEVRAGGFEYRANAAQANIGSLNIGKTANGFKVGWASRDLDAGYSLGRRLSTGRGLEKALSQDPQVFAMARIENGEYVARVRGSDRWVRVAEEEQASVKLDGEWQARVAGLEPNAKSIKLQWVDEGWVKEKVGSSRYEQLVNQSRLHTKPAEEVLDSIVREDYIDAARRITRDPVALYAELDHSYRLQLSHADELIHAGKPGEAADYLERMSHTWGPTPDITARRALALADRKDLAGAARAMERQVGDRSENVEQVYKELNRRIQESAAHPEQESWEALRAASEWKMVGAGGNPKLGVEGGRLELQYHLAAKGEKAAPVTVNEAIHSKAAVYVQDSPALRNLDWSVDMQRSLQQAVEGDLATVVRLQRMDVAHFRPAKIYAPDDTAVLRKVNRPAETVSRAGQNAYRSYRSSECFGSPDGRVRAGCPEDQQAVYLVVPKGDARRYE